MSAPPALRTTADLVRGIISVPAARDLTPFIRTANELTTAICTYATNPYTDGYVDSRMELIERWLSAHFYTIFDNQLTRAKAGTADVSFQYKIDYGLKNSMYGQQAIMLDTRGGLAAWDNSAKEMRRIKIDVIWMGSCWDGYYPVCCG